VCFSKKKRVRVVRTTRGTKTKNVYKHTNGVQILFERFSHAVRVKLIFFFILRSRRLAAGTKLLAGQK